MLDIIQHGFVAAAPELRYTPNQEAVASVRVLTTDRWVDKETGEERERTTGLYWECWGKSAENLAKLLNKGSQVLITGTIRNESWDDDKTGEKRYRDKYMIRRWKLLDRKPQESAAEGQGDEYPHFGEPSYS